MPSAVSIVIQPGRAEPERRCRPPPARQQRHEDECDDQQPDERQEQRGSRHHRERAGASVPGPAVGDQPLAATARDRELGEDVIEQAIRRRGRPSLDQPGCEGRVELVARGHAVRPRSIDDPRVGVERRAHRLDASMEARFGAYQRDAEQLCDLDEAVALEVMQHEDGALIDAESPEAALQLVAVEHAGQLVVAGPVAQGHLADLHRMPATVWRASRWRRRTSTRWSQASKRSGSRNADRSRHAATSASCVASAARSASRRISWPARTGGPSPRGRSVERPRSPSIARSTSLRSIRPPSPRA